MISLGRVRARARAISSMSIRLILAPHAVGYRLEPFSAHVDGRAVSQMPARGQIQAHEGVARTAAGPGTPPGSSGCRNWAAHWRSWRRTAAWRARWPGSRRCRRIRSRHNSACRIALGIFVGQDRALGLEHSLGDDIFRGDQLDLVLLAAQLLADGGEDLFVPRLAGPRRRRRPSSRRRRKRSGTWRGAFRSKPPNRRRRRLFRRRGVGRATGVAANSPPQPGREQPGTPLTLARWMFPTRAPRGTCKMQGQGGRKALVRPGAEFQGGLKKNRQCILIWRQRPTKRSCD